MAIISGNELDNFLESLNDGDVLDGMEGNDILVAQHNNVTLYGGSGIDVLESSAGADNTTMDGGPGGDDLIGFGTNDTASYANDPAGVTVNLSAGLATDGYGDTDTLFGIENVTGSAFDDSLTGDDFANVLQGGAGNDTLTGNGGADVFKFSFDLEQGSGGGGTPLSFGDWLTTEHALNIGNLRQNEFVQNYKEWLGYLAEELRENHGFDTIPENAKVSFKQNDPGGMPKIEGLTEAELGQIFGDATAISIKTGKTSQERYYSDIDTSSGIWGGGSEDILTSGDGNDTIRDFANSGDDILRFDFTADAGWDTGMSVDEQLDFLQSFFAVASVDTGGVAGDDSTKISAGGWSTTLNDQLYVDADADGFSDVFDHVDIYVNDVLIG